MTVLAHDEPEEARLRRGDDHEHGPREEEREDRNDTIEHAREHERRDDGPATENARLDAGGCYPSGVRGWAALLGLTLVGCPPAADPCPSLDAGPPAVDLGTGLDRFIALPDGAELEVVHGPQGGWHVEVSARLSGFDPEGIPLRFEVQDESGAIVAEVRLALLRRRLLVDGCAWLRTDIVVLSQPDPPAVLGALVTVRVVVEIAGAPLISERTVRVVDRL